MNAIVSNILWISNATLISILAISATFIPYKIAALFAVLFGNLVTCLFLSYWISRRSYFLARGGRMMYALFVQLFLFV